ncbi:inositol monophosphatase [Candidatus Parcubacteria bacterium]|nr:inositol monophosphatase [Candidatus Parcubacteria bacterium]
MQNRYDFVVALAKEAGEKVLQAREKHVDISIKNNDPRDLVTNVDIEVSQFISQRIGESFPGEKIYSEEADDDISSGSFWAIDPIDGTKNFVRGFPMFSVVIAYVEKDKASVGAVYNPITKELYSFERGRGAFLNQIPIHVSNKTELKESTIFLTTGRNQEQWEWGTKMYRFLLEYSHSVRGIASSGLDICSVAAGRSEACIYANLTTIDVIAAIGILEEAGGLAEGKSGALDPMSKVPQILIAANNQEILSALRAAL